EHGGSDGAGHARPHRSRPERALGHRLQLRGRQRPPVSRQPPGRDHSDLRPGHHGRRPAARRQHQSENRLVHRLLSRGHAGQGRGRPRDARLGGDGWKRRPRAEWHLSRSDSSGSIVMAQLAGLLVSQDDAFKKQIGRLLRACAIPVAVIEDRGGREGAPPDLIVVDSRGDATSAMSNIERLRAGAPNAGIFAVALETDPELILQSMRAGATEFLTWPPADETFHGAVRRLAARRETALGSRASATTLVFFGAKGGAGTTTCAVNCAVELARLSKRSTVIVDLKPGLGEVALFLGVRPRY